MHFDHSLLTISGFELGMIISQNQILDFKAQALKLTLPKALFRALVILEYNWTMTDNMDMEVKRGRYTHQQDVSQRHSLSISLKGTNFHNKNSPSVYP